MRIKRVLWLVPLVVALMLGALVIPGGIALADTTQNVTINATPSFISISNSPSTFSFGMVAAGANNTTENSTTGWFALTDTSTVNVTTTIKVSANWTSWAWGSPAPDTAYLVASDGDGAYDIAVPDQPAAATTLHASASIGEDWTWEIGLEAPTEFTTGSIEECTILLTGAPS